MKKSIQKKKIIKIKIKRVITKILRLDENNQYGYGMTKLLPTGCIKQNLDITWRSFNLLLQNVNLHDQIGHLYVANIEFDHTKATENIVYNEIYPPIIEKQKIIIHVKGQYISCLNNILQQKREIHNHINQLKKLTRRFLKKI